MTMIDAEDEAIRRLILETAKALVDQTEQVLIDLTYEDSATVLRLRVAPSDVGKVIGKQGRTARSIRTILNGAGMRAQKRYQLEIVEQSRMNQSSRSTESIAEGR